MGPTWLGMDKTVTPFQVTVRFSGALSPAVCCSQKSKSYDCPGVVAMVCERTSKWLFERETAQFPECAEKRKLLQKTNAAEMWFHPVRSPVSKPPFVARFCALAAAASSRNIDNFPN